MRRSVDALLDRHLGRYPKLVKLVKYSAASAAGLATSQTVLIGGVVVFEMAARYANLLGVTAGAIPNYLINRAWTFNKQGSHSMTREILPFWGMAFLGVIFSTLAVEWAERRYGANAFALSSANIGSFAILWIVKFIILDRVLFKPLVEFVEQHEDPDGHFHIHANDDH